MRGFGENVRPFIFRLRFFFFMKWRSSQDCQDPAGNRTIRRPSGDHKETQTAVVWSCLPFIRSGQNHLARHIERGKKTTQTEEEVGRQHQGMDLPGVRKVPVGSEKQGKMEETSCKIICGAPATLAIKGYMMMMMMIMMTARCAKQTENMSRDKICHQSEVQTE